MRIRINFQRKLWEFINSFQSYLYPYNEIFFKSTSLTSFRSLSCLCFVTVNLQMTENLQTILSRTWFNCLQIVERVGGAVFRLDLQELLLGQNYILSCQWSSTLAMNRNLKQRKSTVVAVASMITSHYPFCPDQQGATTNAGFRRTPASLPFRVQKAVSRIFGSRTILGLIENAKAKINVLDIAKFPV